MRFPRTAVAGLAWGVWMLACAVGVVVLYHQFYRQPTFGAVDVQGILASEIQLVAQNEALSEEQRNDFVGLFAKAIEESLKGVAAQHHVVLVVKPAIIAGSAVDYTDTVRGMIRANLPQFYNQ